MRPPDCSLLLTTVVLPTLLLCSCSSTGGSDRLLVETDGPRYGAVSGASSTSLPIKRADGIAELFVPVQIGTSSGWWQIDTGAALSVVNSRIATYEGFAIREAGEILTPAGTADANVGVVPSVRLGSITIREVTVLSLDDRYSNDFQIDGRSGSVIGILGSDLLDHLGATIDYRSNRLYLRAP